VHLCILGDFGSEHIQRWVRFYVGRGHRVSVVTFRPGPDVGAEVHVVRTPIKTKARYLVGLPAVRRLVRSISPDLVHAHYATSYGLLGALTGARPLVITAHGDDVLVAPEESRLLRRTVRWALEQADLVTAVSPALATAIRRLTSDQVRPDVFQYGVDLQELPFQPPRSGDAGPQIISTRHLEDLYDVETLVRAVPLIRRQVADVQVVICGDGPLRHQLRRLADELVGSAVIVFRGALPFSDLALELRQADIYVSTSRHDGLSLSLLEAMAVGVYPVVTDIPANRQLIVDGRNGFLVPCGDAEALAQRILDSWKLSELRRSAAQLNRAYVEREADRRIILGRFESRYRELRALQSNRTR
jgi:L-malate glycosyltransferase